MADAALAASAFSILRVCHISAGTPQWHGVVGGVSTQHVGDPTMPRTASSIFAYEPEHIQAMHRAFDAVCAKLELSMIIELGRAGEQDANRLTARTLAEFGVGNDGSLLRH